MDHGPVVSPGDVPVARDRILGPNGVYRADPRTEATALAGERIDSPSLADDVIGWSVKPERIEMAGFGAFPAANALRGVDRSLRPAHEGMRFAHKRSKQQMKVGRVHIVIGQHHVVRKYRERCRHRCLPGTTLSADNRDFLVIRGIPHLKLGSTLCNRPDAFHFRHCHNGGTL